MFTLSTMLHNALYVSVPGGWCQTKETVAVLSHLTHWTHIQDNTCILLYQSTNEECWKCIYEKDDLYFWI